MINLAVINIKDIIKILKTIFLGIILFFIAFNLFKKFDYTKIENLKIKSSFYYSKILNNTLVISKYFENGRENFKRSNIKKVLTSELSLLASEEELMEKENQEEMLEEKFEENVNENIIKEEIQIENEVEKNVIEEVKLENNLQEKVETKIILENNKKDTYTDIYKSVKIKNESKYELTEEILNSNINFSNNTDIVIYHTHTCESYTPTEVNKYEASGNFRTTDLNFSVARVGEELTKNLITKGFNVNHDKTYHDYPAYTGSYSRSLSTIKNITSTNSAQLIIDLHRDALGSNSSYAPSVQIGDEIAAQLMFVMGTNGGGLEHNNWKNNLKFAIKVQEKANELYPGLFKPIILRNSRYNQHVSDSACIIEVGATGNTLEQCIVSMKYLSNVINEVMKENKL